MHYIFIPLGKLVQMLFTQVSKPLAYRIALYAKRRPFFKNNFCLPLARLYGLSDKMMQRKDQPPKPVLTDEEALELGTTIMAEGLIYLIAACLVINEYNRRGNKASENEDQKKADIDSLRETVDQLLKKVEEQEGVIKDLVNKSADSNKIIETDGLPK